jgi:hypothetical protein
MAGYLDQYGAGEERRNRVILRTVIITLSAAILISLSWYLFRNHHQEGVVKSFVDAIRRRDFQGAYRDWGCTPEKPCKGYAYDKFIGDWGPKREAAAGDDAPDSAVFGLTDSESCNNGVLLTLSVNRSRTEKLWVQRDSDAISFAPYPICPHKNPWAIMLHRTIGRLRKPLLK